MRFLQKKLYLFNLREILPESSQQAICKGGQRTSYRTTAIALLQIAGGAGIAQGELIVPANMEKIANMETLIVQKNTLNYFV
jgi:hypothetical protein